MAKTWLRFFIVVLSFAIIARSQTKDSVVYCQPDLIELENSVVFLSCVNNRKSTIANCGKMLVKFKIFSVHSEIKPVSYKFVVSAGKIIRTRKKLFWDLIASKPGVQTITVNIFNGKKIIETYTKTLTVKLCGDCD